MASLSSLNFRLTANIAPFKKGLNKAERALDSMGKKMQQTGKNLSMKLTAPLAALGAVSYNVFKNFEAEMSKVKAVSGATAQEFEALSKNAKELGASTAFGATEVAQLQTEFAKLGFTADEITKVTEGTLNLAQAAGSELPRAAEVAGSTLRAFGLAASETNRVTDVMALSFSSSALDMEVFAESMKYVAPVAKSAGMSLEQTSAMLAVLANNGIKGSAAGTALRRIISQLGATGGDVQGAIKNLAAEGLNLADAKDEVGRSAQSALLILAEGIDQIDPLTESFENSAGAAKEMSDIMGENAWGAGKRLESAMEGLGISLGEIIAEAIVPMVEGLASFVSWLNESSPTTKRLIVTLGGLLAAVGPLLFIVGGMIRNFRILSSAIKASNVVTKIAAVVQRAYNAVLNANPIGIVITAVFALAAAFVYLSSKQKKSNELMEEMSDETKDLVAEMQVQKRQMNNLFKALKDSNTQEDKRKLIIEELNTKYKDYLPNLLSEKDTIEDIAAAQREANDEFRKKIKITVFEDQIKQKTEKAINAQKDLNKLQEIYMEGLAEGFTHEEMFLSPVVMKGEGFSDLLTSDAGFLGGMTDLRHYDDLVAELEAHISKASEEIAHFEDEINQLSPALENTEFEETTEDVDDLANKFDDAAEELKKLRGESEKTAEKVEDLNEEIDDLEISEVSFNEGIFEDLEEDVEQFDNSFTKAYEKAKLFATKYKELGQGIAEVMHQASVDTIAGMAEIAGAMVTGEASFADLRQFALAQFAGLLEQLGKMFIQYGISVESFVKALALGPTPMAAALAVGAGVAMIAAAGAIRSKMKSASEAGIPAMAEGGIVTGPTLALIGEGKESEAVIPLSKLNTMIQGGSQQVEVYGRISGSDILLSQERAQRNRTRQRGF